MLLVHLVPMVGYTQWVNFRGLKIILYGWPDRWVVDGNCTDDRIDGLLSFRSYECGHCMLWTAHIQRCTEP